MKDRALEMVDIMAIYDYHAQAAVESINETTGELKPTLIAVDLTDDPGRIERITMIDPRLISMLQRNGRTKDVLMAIVNMLLSKIDEAESPDAVVHVSEVWTLKSNRSNAQPFIDGRDHVIDHPDHAEALMVNIHTRARTYTGICPIENVGGGRRRAVFKPLDPTVTGFGRLFVDPEPGRAAH